MAEGEGVYATGRSVSTEDTVEENGKKQTIFHNPLRNYEDFMKVFGNTGKTGTYMV